MKRQYLVEQRILPRQQFVLAIVLCICLRPAVAALAEPSNLPILRIEPGGSTAGVRQVEFSPDGKMLYSVGDDKAIRAWSVETGRQTQVLRAQIGAGAQGEIFAEAVSPDGKRLACGGYDEFATNQDDVRVFDLATGDIEQVLAGCKEPIASIDYSPDGTLIAAAGQDYTVYVWDTASGRLVHEFKGHTDGVYGVRFSPDGTMLASGSLDKTVRLWSIASGACITVTVGSPVMCLAWTSDGKDVLSGDASGKVRFWNAEGAEDGSGFAQADPIQTLAVSSDGQTIATGGSRSTEVRLWSRSGQSISKFAGHSFNPWSIAFSPAGDLAASADWTGRICLWSTSTGRLKHELAGNGQSPYNVEWSTGAHVRQVSWSLTKGGPLSQSFDLDGGTIGAPVSDQSGWSAADLDHDGRSLAIASDQQSVNVTDGGRQVATIVPGGGEDVQCCGWTPSGQVVVGSAFGLSLYDIGRSPEVVERFLGHEGPVTSVSVSPDGAYLASTGADQTVRIWPLSAQTGDHKAPADIAPIMSIFTASNGEWVAWSPAGYYTSSANGDQMIGWQVNHGPSSAAEFFTASQFQKLFYRPDVMSNLMQGGGSIDTALDLANAASKEREASLERQVADLEKQQTDLESQRDGQQQREDALRSQLTALEQQQRDAEAQREQQTTDYQKQIKQLEDEKGKLASQQNLTDAQQQQIQQDKADADNLRKRIAADEAAQAKAAADYQRQLKELEDEKNRLADQEQQTEEDAAEAKRERDEADALKQQIAAAQAHPQPEVTVEQIVKIAPPKIQITEPEPDKTVTVGTVTLTADISDPNGHMIKDVDVLVNGRRSRDLQRVSLGTSITFNQSLDLWPGKNLITVVASNDAGSESPAQITVFYKPADAATDTTHVPTLHLVAIGVSHYENVGPDLHYAAKDAQDIATALMKQQGRLFDKVDVTVLTDKDATRSSIIHQLGRLKHEGEVDKDDYVIFYFSGHGTGDTGDNFCIVPYDAQDGDDIEDTCVPWSTLRSDLSEIDARCVMLLLDTCHAGGIGGQRIASDATQAVHEMTAPEGGVVTLASCGAGQLSVEEDKEQNGVFTHALIDGLNGEADTLNTGEVTIENLIDYVVTEVKRDTGGAQIPTHAKSIAVPDDLPIARLSDAG